METYNGMRGDGRGKADLFLGNFRRHFRGY